MRYSSTVNGNGIRYSLINISNFCSTLLLLSIVSIVSGPMVGKRLAVDQRPAVGEVKQRNAKDKGFTGSQWPLKAQKVERSRKRVRARRRWRIDELKSCMADWLTHCQLFWLSQSEKEEALPSVTRDTYRKTDKLLIIRKQRNKETISHRFVTHLP